MNQIKYIDLFCGIGSFHYSFQKLGWECVMASDINKAASDTYQANYNMTTLGDILDIEPSSIPQYDILCAGFPCFIEGTKVLTQCGYKNIEDVQLNDNLLTHTGNFQNILNLQRKIYNGELYNIKIKYHPTVITCTEEHPFYVREKKCFIKNNKVLNTFDKPQWKKANELTKNDYIGMVVNTNNLIPEFTIDKRINQHKTEKIMFKLDRKEYWFMMGYFVGDGWIEETVKKDGRCMHKIRFAINNKDEKEVFDMINDVIPITDKRCDSGFNKKCKKFGCSDYTWYTILKMFGKYAHGKLIPEWVQDAPVEFVQEFINGYMKADGCITGKDVHSITTVSHNLAYGTQRLYLKLGHIFSVIKCKRPIDTIIEGRTVQQRDTYRVTGVLMKKRKFTSFIEDNYVWYAPCDISTKKTTNTLVYNFEVENDNSYVVENTIVHNCQPFSQCGKQKGFDDTRGTLFFNIMKFVRFHTPKVLILENVQGLLNHDNGNTFIRIKEEIEEANYTITYKVVKCSDYGLPQMRKRLIIVGVRNDTLLVKKIESLLSFEEFKRNVSLSTLLSKNFEKEMAYTIRCGGRKSPLNDRHNWDGYIVDGEEYRLTIEDCLQIQGFDKNFILCGTQSDKWKQLGNTIPTIFTEIIGLNLKKNIELF